jgi:S-(hydroxymethyl)glutathione dehydrogenase / alcohol dehydrogenase
MRQQPIARGDLRDFTYRSQLLQFSNEERDECSRRGWGQSIVIGVAPAGAEISTRPFQLVTGRVWKGTDFGGARGRTDVPKIVDWYMQGKIQIDPMITHVMPLAEINNASELMKRGESIRGVVTF